MQDKFEQALTIVCLCLAMVPEEQTLETMGECLVIIRQVINHLAQAPSLFPTPEAHKRFFKFVFHRVRLANYAPGIIKGFNTEMDDQIEQVIGELPRDHDDIYTDELHWHIWTRNTVVLGSDEMCKAILRKSNFKVTSLFLPRGGCAISEQWRADLNSVVNDMLQV